LAARLRLRPHPLFSAKVGLSKIFILLKKIPRVKDATDWLLTWSPEDDLAKNYVGLEPFIAQGFEEFKWTRMLAVIECTGELHILFSTERSYNSDYKWWAKHFVDEKCKAPAFDLKYHDNFCGAVGYLLKKEDTRILLCSGIAEEQIAYGKEQYARGLRRQRCRTFLGKHRIIHPRQWDAAVGAYIAETGGDENRAITELVRDGFVFSGSGGLETSREYARLYKQDTAMQAVQQESDSLGQE